MEVPLLFKSSQDTNMEVRLTSPEGSHTVPSIPLVYVQYGRAEWVGEDLG